jgi:hypothetical protein
MGLSALQGSSSQHRDKFNKTFFDQSAQSYSVLQRQAVLAMSVVGFGQALASTANRD